MLNETATSAVTMRRQGTRRHAIVVCCALQALLAQVQDHSSAAAGVAEEDKGGATELQSEAKELRTALSGLWTRIFKATEEPDDADAGGAAAADADADGSSSAKAADGKGKSKAKGKGKASKVKRGSMAKRASDRSAAAAASGGDGGSKKSAADEEGKAKGQSGSAKGGKARRGSITRPRRLSSAVSVEGLAKELHGLADGVCALVARMRRRAADRGDGSIGVEGSTDDDHSLASYCISLEPLPLALRSIMLSVFLGCTALELRAATAVTATAPTGAASGSVTSTGASAAGTHNCILVESPHHRAADPAAAAAAAVADAAGSKTATGADGEDADPTGQPANTGGEQATGQSPPGSNRAAVGVLQAHPDVGRLAVAGPALSGFAVPRGVLAAELAATARSIERAMDHPLQVLPGLLHATNVADSSGSDGSGPAAETEAATGVGAPSQQLATLPSIEQSATVFQGKTPLGAVPAAGFVASIDEKSVVDQAAKEGEGGGAEHSSLVPVAVQEPVPLATVNAAATEAASAAVAAADTAREISLVMRRLQPRGGDSDGPGAGSFAVYELREAWRDAVEKEEQKHPDVDGALAGTMVRKGAAHGGEGHGAVKGLEGEDWSATSIAAKFGAKLRKRAKSSKMKKRKSEEEEQAAR